MIEGLAVDAFAGYALGRLVANDTVTLPIANRVFMELCDVDVPPETWTGYPDDVANAARELLDDRLLVGLDDDTIDMRALHRAGWTRPLGSWQRWAADLLSCPICSSFHALWIARLFCGRARPWSPSWWVLLFAGWGAAQVAIRATPTEDSIADLALQAIMDVSNAQGDHENAVQLH